MRNISRILFAIAGIAMPIFVGLLHTYVHFTDLITPDVIDIMQSEVTIMGEKQKAWNSWGMMSFMMGMSFVVIGLLNLAILRRTGQTKTNIPIVNYIAMIVYLLCVIYVGKTFEAFPQLYGGIIGMLFIVISMYLNKTDEPVHVKKS